MAAQCHHQLQLFRTFQNTPCVQVHCDPGFTVGLHRHRDNTRTQGCSLVLRVLDVYPCCKYAPLPPALMAPLMFPVPPLTVSCNAPCALGGLSALTPSPLQSPVSDALHVVHIKTPSSDLERRAQHAQTQPCGAVQYETPNATMISKASPSQSHWGTGQNWAKAKCFAGPTASAQCPSMQHPMCCTGCACPHPKGQTG